MNDQKITSKEAVAKAGKEFKEWIEERLTRPDTPEYRRITELEDEITRLQQQNSRMEGSLNRARDALY